MKKAFADILVILVVSFLLSYTKMIFTAGFEHYDKWLLPLFYALFYGTIISVAFVVSIRVFRSELMLLVMSVVLNLILLAFEMKKAGQQNFTFYQNGEYWFLNGEITSYGLFYELLNPLIFMSFLAILMIVCSYLRQSLKNERI